MIRQFARVRTLNAKDLRRLPSISSLLQSSRNSNEINRISLRNSHSLTDGTRRNLSLSPVETTMLTRDSSTAASGGEDSGKKLEMARMFLAYVSQKGKYDSHVEPIEPVRVEGKSLLFRFTVTEPQLNANNRIHGGYIAYLVDVTTTIALMINTASSSVGIPNPGVSVDLSVSYLSSAKPGDVLLMKATLVKSGKNLAFTEAVITKEENNMTVASGKHTKFVGNANL